MSETILEAIHREMRSKKLLKDNSDSEKDEVCSILRQNLNSELFQAGLTRLKKEKFQKKNRIQSNEGSMTSGIHSSW